MKNVLLGLFLLTHGTTQPTTGLSIHGRVIDEGALPQPTTGGGGQGNGSLGVYLIHNGATIQTTSVRGNAGTFLFQGLGAGRYFVTLEPNVADLPPREVVLADKNIEDLQIRIPTAVLSGTFNVEGDGIRPAIRLLLTSTVRGAGARTYSISDPTFSLTQIPVGVYGIEIQNLPPGYALKSIMAGTTDLHSQKLSLTAVNPPTIAITLTVSP